jgi:hypothetical protein
MAKTSGIGSALYVGQYDLSGDTGEISSAETSRAVIDVTSIADVAASRLLGRSDGNLSFAGFWNVSAGKQHPVLSALPTTDRIVSYFQGATLGNAAASIVAKQVTYTPSFQPDGSIVTSTNALANGYPLEWGEALTAGLQSFATGTVSGSSIDFGATETLFGAAAYLHVITMPSGTAAFTVQDSANDADWTNVAGMSFTGITGPTSARLQGAVDATIRRYVRINGTGTHGTSLIAVNFVRYLTSSAA